MNIKKLNEQLNEFVEEKDDYELLNEELVRITDNLKARLTHLCDRFNYRTMINRSYSISDAEDLFAKCQNAILQMEKEVDRLSGQEIG